MANPTPASGEEHDTSDEAVAFDKHLLNTSTYTVALLCGGSSSERQVSLSGAAHVEQALALAGHTVVIIDTASPCFLEELQNLAPDVAFIVLHGKGGEDGTLQAVLELLQIPYTGSGVLGSALAMDKHRAKIIYEAHGLNTPFSLYIKASQKDSEAALPQSILERIALPVVVKPIDDGSSFGITMVRDKETLPVALDHAFASGSNVLVEQYISGTEITVSVLGSTELRALPAIEIVPKNDFYDYESKYLEGGSEHIIPARISPEALSKAQRMALIAHEALGCYSVSRTDMIIDEEDTVWVIETNTIPGMTSTSLLPDAAKHVGISNQELCNQLVAWALERNENKDKGEQDA